MTLRDNTLQLRGTSYICLTLLIRGGFTQRCDHGIRYVRAKRIVHAFVIELEQSDY